MSESLAPGLEIGPYRLGRLLGRGGMGAVYEAEHLQLGKRVAVKFLAREVATSEHAIDRFVREGRAAARVRHPHVVEVYDVGVHDGVPYLVMEYLEGTDLETELEARHRLGPTETVDLMLPVLAAMHAVHLEGVIHRDLKPGNIFLARVRVGGIEPKIVDFGISKLTDDGGKNLTATSSMLGTPYYMAPEQARGAKLVTPKSDQYALGVILYECLAGHRPFEADTLFAIIHCIVTGDHAPLAEAAPDVPRALASVVEKAMSVDEEARFPTVAHLGLALLPFASASARARWEPTFVDACGGAAPATATASSRTTAHEGGDPPPRRFLRVPLRTYVLRLVIGIPSIIVIVGLIGFVRERWSERRRSAEEQLAAAQRIAWPPPIVDAGQGAQPPVPAVPPCPEGMVLVSAGSTRLGLDAEPTVEVAAPFCIDRREASFRDVRGFCGDATSEGTAPTSAACRSIAACLRDADAAWRAATDSTPHGCFSASAAEAFCLARGPSFRLPSDAEWLRAATGGADGPWPWSDDDDAAAQAAVTYREGDTFAARIARLASEPSGRDASPFGAIGMIGGLSEWACDQRQDGRCTQVRLHGGSLNESLAEIRAAGGIFWAHGGGTRGYEERGVRCVATPTTP